MLSRLIPAIIILLPIVLFSIHGLSAQLKTRRQVLISGLIFLSIGLVVPWIASSVSAYGLYAELPDIWLPARGSGNRLAEKMLDDRSEYVSKAMFFFYYGYLINLLGIPFLGVIFYKARKVKK
jgi:hypothetical protein